MNVPKETLQEHAIYIASEIHHTYKNSYWAQQFLLQELRAELERLDTEYNESEQDK
jgi:hypothetical protein